VQGKADVNPRGNNLSNTYKGVTAEHAERAEKLQNCLFCFSKTENRFVVFSAFSARSAVTP
jgi:hypothetical protein